MVIFKGESNPLKNDLAGNFQVRISVNNPSIYKHKKTQMKDNLPNVSWMQLTPYTATVYKSL